MKRPGTLARTAKAHVFFSTRRTRTSPALIRRRCPRQTAAPVRGSRDLPASDDQVLRAPCVSGKGFTLAERQLVTQISHPNVGSDLTVRPVREWMADREIVGVVRVRFGQRVMREELQTMREPMIHFHLQRVVDAIRIIAQVVPLVRGAAS